MKLRIHQNSIRVRLTQTETKALGEGRAVQQETVISPTASLVAVVQPSTTVSQLHVDMTGQCLTIHVPSTLAHIWATSDDVGINACLDILTGQSLKVLIEKDFQCLHFGVEDNADAFPNPNSK